ncbi:hypothetical protein NUH88_14060 [Nisaea acidiphila]|uniref:Uncharacterized protein n=1 Tax=Nisaea acidiphila TaxID=1862145 RepID=A0A9J7AT39_9PROT|nr:hypothetical protein [Nisaea acidiphila]UUX48533.1 hypothetical protein NUH88_14060 [Nisaea acidiphila]
MKAALLILIEGATMLFASFGGFLSVVAPPPGSNDTISAVGLASFVAVIIFAVIKLLLTLCSEKIMRNVTISLATVSGIFFVCFGTNYLYEIDRSTFRFPEHGNDSEIFLAADTLTEDAQTIIKADPKLEGAHAALLAKAGVDQIHTIWPPNAVVEKRSALTIKYLFMVITLSLCLGFSIEGLALSKK